MQTIVAAIDFSPVSDPVLEFAADLARATKARLVLVHIAAPEPDFVSYDVGPETEREAVAKRLRQQHRQLQELADGLRETGLDVTALLIQGPTVEKLLEESQRLDAGLLVVGSHGRGAIGRVLLGSVSEAVVRRASCPVTVVPAAAQKK